MLKLICSVCFIPERIVPLKATCSQCDNGEGYVVITPTKELVSVITFKGKRTQKECSLDILRLIYSYLLITATPNLLLEEQIKRGRIGRKFGT